MRLGARDEKRNGEYAGVQIRKTERGREGDMYFNYIWPEC